MADQPGAPITEPYEVRRFDDGGPWIERFGYTRALRVGDRIEISGTTGSADDGSPVTADVYGQAVAALEKINRAVCELAGDDEALVVRTRVYLVRADDWQEVGRAHSAAFGEHRPVNTTLEIGALIGEGLLVEIEAEAVVL